MNLPDLIARLEAATGPDRGLDAEIWLAVTPGATRKHTTVAHSAGTYVIDETREASGRLVTVPAYTASIDAALQLVPEGWEWNLSGTTVFAFARVANDGLRHEPCFTSHLSGMGATNRYAIALCIASLKARIP